jgi:signal transduction histidine kinase/CheY-like chemotaxis protein
VRFYSAEPQRVWRVPAFGPAQITRQPAVTRRSTITLHRLLLLASVLVPAALFGAAAVQNRAEILREGRHNIIRTTAVMHEHARKVLETEDLVLDRIDAQLRGMNDAQIAAPATSAFLHDLKAPQEQSVSIWVTDANGTVLAGSQPWDHSLGLVGRDFFDVQRDRDSGTYVSKAFRGKATQLASFAVSRRRVSADGSFAGTIHVSLSPEYFKRFFQEAAPEPAHLALLLRSDGAILARDPPDNQDQIPVDQKLAEMLRAQPDGGYSDAGHTRTGQRRMFAYRKVVGYPVYVAFGIQANAVLQPWRQNLLVFGSVAALASATLLLVSWLALRRAWVEQRLTARLRLALDQLHQESEQRHAAEQKLHHAQRLEAVGQLTGGVAHDFNNLLTVILGNLERIANATTNEPKVHRMASSAMRAVQRGSQLTSSLLAFSRRQQLKTQRVDCNTLLREFEELLRRGVGERVTLRLNLAPDLAACHADAAQLEAALLNLAINARDAMPNGGELIVTTRNAQLAAADLAANDDTTPGPFIAVSVQDNGVGMSAEIKARVFEPFFTTKEVGRGTGLGLSQVYGFVRQLGGHVTIESEVGRGTTITLYLPRAGAVERAPETGRVPQQRSPGSASVLVVEDDPDVRELTSAVLREAGYPVMVAEDGPSALALLTSERQIDLMVCDMVMPGGLNGLAVARQARILRPGLVVLLTSGHDTSAEPRGTGDAAGPPDGVDAVLRKPYGISDLLSMIATLLPAEQDA